MSNLIIEAVENVNTGLTLEFLPIIIAGVVLVAAIVLGIVLSQISKKNKKKKKAQKKSSDN